MIETRTPAPAATASPGTGRESRGWRLSARMRKLVLSVHVLVAVGWFGVVLAKLILEVAAVTAADPTLARAAYLFMGRFDRVTFPPATMAALVTGVVLSVGTAWGLFQHYWIVAKLVLTVAVIVTGVIFVGAWTQQALEGASALAAGSATGSPAGSAPRLLIGATVAHLLMLGAATVISVYKPWGRIRPARATV